MPAAFQSSALQLSSPASPASPVRPTKSISRQKQPGQPGHQPTTTNINSNNPVNISTFLHLNLATFTSELLYLTVCLTSSHYCLIPTERHSVVPLPPSPPPTSPHVSDHLTPRQNTTVSHTNIQREREREIITQFYILIWRIGLCPVLPRATGLGYICFKTIPGLQRMSIYLLTTSSRLMYLFGL